VKSRKMDQYLAEGERLVALVNDYRAVKGAASAEGAPSLQSGSPDPDCNKRKSYKLPPLAGPTEIPGYPLNPTPAQEMPDYGTIGRVKATRAAQAARRGKKAPLTPSGPPVLRKANQ
jgi:hypothetical protein